MGALVDGPQSQITSLLTAVEAGDAGAAERLWRVVYDELHHIAHAKMSHESRPGELQTTVLVQEAFLRLMGNAGGGDNGSAPPLNGMPHRSRGSRTPPAATLVNRRYFFAAAANAMRQFLVDDARKRGRMKRGGKQTPGEIGGALGVFERDPAEVLAVNEALAKLRARDPQKADIVQCRYFAELSIDETAEALGVSPRLVDKEWRFAKAWLKRELSGD
jgi:DNA-directed RNA polymerase specialized sigma24 family protein